jgi:uncharacterized protein (DUF983 family)
VEVVTLNRTLDQELMALMRGASLECPECGSGLRKAGEATLHLDVQAG